MKRSSPDESPARGSKPRQAPAARKPARGRTAPLEARFRAAAAEPDVLVRLALGPEHASSLQARAELLADDHIAATRELLSFVTGMQSFVTKSTSLHII